MTQVARNLTMEERGLLKPGQYLIHDHDTKFCTAFKYILDEAGVQQTDKKYDAHFCMPPQLLSSRFSL